jgi:hypothetical protein
MGQWIQTALWWLSFGRSKVRANCIRCGNRQWNVQSACNFCGCPALVRCFPFVKDTTI